MIQTIEFDEWIQKLLKEYQKRKLLTKLELDRLLNIWNTTLSIAKKKWIISIKIYKRIQTLINS